MTTWSRLFAALGVGAALTIAAPELRAQDYPNKTIDWIAAFGAGGGTDRWARVISTAALDVLGEPIHVRNMPGASGVVAWQHLLEQPADGYTLYHASSTPVLGLLSEEDAPVGPDQLKVVAYVSKFRSLLLAVPDAPWAGWDSFKTYARENPGEISIGGTLSLLVGVAAVIEEEGLEVTYVPYSSTGSAIADFLGGHISAAAGTASTALTLVPDEATVVLNTSNLPLSEESAEALGNPPLATELEYQDAISFPNLVGVHPDTPDEIVELLSTKIGQILEQESVKQLISKMGEEIIFVPHAEAAAEYDKMVASMENALGYLQ